MPVDPGPRERILTAALAVLADDGLSGFTHRRIEERAGMSHGSTTYHFGTRDELYDAVVQRLLEHESLQARLAMEEVQSGSSALSPEANPLLGQPFDTHVDWRSEDAIALVRHYSTALMARMLTDSAMNRVRFEIYIDASRTPGGLERLTAARQAIYVAQMEQSKALGYPDPLLYSRMLVALIDGLTLHHLSVPDDVIEQRSGEMIMLCLDSMYHSRGDRDRGSS